MKIVVYHKKGKNMKQNLLRKSLIIAVGISAVYIVISYGLMFTELLFREWVDACGILWTGIVVPFLGLFMIRQGIYEKYDITKVKGIIIHLIALVCFVVWAFFVLLFLIFNVDEEKRLTKSLLVANEAEFLQENVFAYYEPVAFFFKKSSSLTQEKKQEYLEEKYGEDDIERYADSYVHVYLESMELKDTLVEEVTVKYVIQALEDLKIDREYFIKELEPIKRKSIYLELQGQEDITKFSEDVSEIFTYINSKTDFFEKYRGVLHFYSGEEENRITGYLPFGKLNSYDNVSKDYYLKSEEMESFIFEKYLIGVANLEDQKAYEKEMAEILLNIQEQAKEMQSKNEGTLENGTVEEQTENQGEHSSGENVTEGVAQNKGFFAEEAARRVYDEYMEAEGYAFEVKYNAKGNLYIDLEYRPAGEMGDKSVTGYYGHELIYNGMSKNGKCELFVLQRSHYTEDHMEESTVIVDMYAVETTTGQVVVADKQSWGAPGTEEYRAITGE